MSQLVGSARHTSNFDIFTTELLKYLRVTRSDLCRVNHSGIRYAEVADELCLILMNYCKLVSYTLYQALRRMNLSETDSNE